jgi:uncharacterized protein YjbI with pentapeptide repeats
METWRRPEEKLMTTKALSIWTGACLAAIVWSGAIQTTLPAGPRADRAGDAAVAAARSTGGSAHLECAVLMQARLTGANLRGAALAGASLAAAHLAGAHLDQADLVGADLTSACLVGADLRGANLAAACLTRANLDGAALAGARYDQRTEWPTGFNPAAHGARRIESARTALYPHTVLQTPLE